jgi:hypothetical protein
MNVYSTSCCGVCEIHGISFFEPKNFFEVFKRVVSDYQNGEEEKPLIYFFTDAIGPKDRSVRSQGDVITELIRKNGYGTVTTSRYKRNPNSGNLVRVFVWNLNAKAQRELL